MRPIAIQEAGKRCKSLEGVIRLITKLVNETGRELFSQMKQNPRGMLLPFSQDKFRMGD